MNRVKIIAIVIAVFGVLSLAVMINRAKLSTPEKAFKTAIFAIESKNVDAYLDCLTAESKNILIKSGAKRQILDNMENQNIAIKEGDYKLIEETEDTAKLSSQKGKSVVILKKEYGKWKIDLRATASNATKKAPAKP